MKELSATKAWALIAEMGWGSRTTDYKHIAETYFKLLGKKGMKQLEKFVGERVCDLGSAVKRYEDGNGSIEVGSDDGFSDVRYHIVGLGKDTFDVCMADPLEIQNCYRLGKYKESFAYAFQEPDPPRTEENKEASRKLLVKNVAALEKQLREIEFELSTARGLFQDINMLLGQVMEDTKSGK